jgi:uncharacterized protein
MDEIYSIFPQIKKENVIFLAYRGSLTRNMATAESDTDYISSYINSLDVYLKLDNIKDAYSSNENGTDAVTYEFKKLLTLLRGGNPNVLEILWTDPKYFLLQTWVYDRLRENRELFLSKAVYNTFVNYAKGQFSKAVSLTSSVLERYEFLEDLLNEQGVDLQSLSPNQATRDRIIWRGQTLDTYFKEFLELKKKYFNGGGRLGARRRELIKKISYDSKNFSVLIMLLKQATELLNYGYLQVEREDKDELMSIRNGEWTLEQVKKYSDELLVLAEKARANSKLPETVNFEAINQLSFGILKDFYKV